MFIRTGQQETGLAANQTTPTQVIKWYIRTCCIKQTGIRPLYQAAMHPGQIWAPVALKPGLAAAPRVRAAPVQAAVPVTQARLPAQAAARLQVPLPVLP